MELATALYIIAGTALVAFIVGAQWGVTRCRKLHFHVHDSTTLRVDGRIDDDVVANMTPNSIIVADRPKKRPFYEDGSGAKFEAHVDKDGIIHGKVR